MAHLKTKFYTNALYSFIRLSKTHFCTALKHDCVKATLGKAFKVYLLQVHSRKRTKIVFKSVYKLHDGPLGR